MIVFDSKTEARHEGITLTVEGTVNMQLSSKNVGIFEAFYNSVKVRMDRLDCVTNSVFMKPVPMVGYTVEVKKNGRLPAGRTEIPFELPLQPKSNRNLFETYHGVFISIQVRSFCPVVNLIIDHITVYFKM